ncbi:MAG TPA: phage holin family protein [Gaiellaceae bacterium]|nr:phage holin family protein [Gaiellaceae bacterium]
MSLAQRGSHGPGIVTLLLLRWGVVALAFAITSWLLSGMEITGGFWAYLWVALLFGIVNALIGTILRILTLPFNLITLGLVSVLVSAVLLAITDALTSHLTIDEFWWTAIWAAIILAVVAVMLELLVGLLFWRDTATAGYSESR